MGGRVRIVKMIIQAFFLFENFVASGALERNFLGLSVPFSHVTFQALEHPSADVAHFRLVVGLPVAVTVDLGQESFRAQFTQELSLSRMDPLGVVAQPGLAGELGVADAAQVSADVLVRCLDVVL